MGETFFKYEKPLLKPLFIFYCEQIDKDLNTPIFNDKSYPHRFFFS